MASKRPIRFRIFLLLRLRVTWLPSFGLAALHKLKAEAALDTEVAPRHVVVKGGGDLDDGVVLDVQVERAADATVAADGRGDLLPRFVPGARLAHVVLALEHQGAGGADADAVAAVDTGGLREADGELGRDAGIEAAAGHRDGEGVLGVGAASLDALKTQYAL